MRREGRIAFCANVSHMIHLSYGSNKEAKKTYSYFCLLSQVIFERGSAYWSVKELLL